MMKRRQESAPATAPVQPGPVVFALNDEEQAEVRAAQGGILNLKAVVADRLQALRDSEHDVHLAKEQLLATVRAAATARGHDVSAGNWHFDEMTMVVRQA